MMSISVTRRQFVGTTLAVGLGTQAFVPRALADKTERMRIGLVTYLWGQDWDLPTLIANCEKTGVLGVELRTQHKHGVESSLTVAERKEVRQRFEDSSVTLLGPGTNWEFHAPDPQELQSNIDHAKEYVKLSYDCGGSGVKVKPNTLPANVPVEKTIEQIGQSLNEVGRFAADLGQEIRVEVHGRQTQQLPIMKRIMDVATEKNVTVCWNCNQVDLQGEGLEYNFNLVKSRFGDTVHVRELQDENYPYAQLFELLVANDYTGWILLECRTNPDDRIAALIEQRHIFEKFVQQARA